MKKLVSSGQYQKFFRKIAPRFFGFAKGGDRWKLREAFEIEPKARPEKMGQFSKEILVLTTSIFLVVLVLVAGCQKKETTKVRPLVVTSIPPYAFLVEEIAGKTVTARSALGPRFDPHNAEATPNQMKIVQEADLFIGVGEAYEEKLIAAIQEGSKNVTILELDQRIPLLSYSQGTEFIERCDEHPLSKDLHFWLSPKRLMMQVYIIMEALSHLSPENKDLYEENGKKLLTKIQQLDQKVERTLVPFEGKAILISHSALGYYCYDYHLKQIVVECEGKSPLPKDAAKMLDAVKGSDVVCVFTAPQFNNRGAELIADKLDLRIESFNPMDEDLFETITQVTRNIIGD